MLQLREQKEKGDGDHIGIVDQIKIDGSSSRIGEEPVREADGQRQNIDEDQRIDWMNAKHRERRQHFGRMMRL